MKIHLLPTEEVIRSLVGDPMGLRDSEALRRLKEYGPNQIPEVAGESRIFRFIREFTHFFALILWFAAALCFFSEINEPGQGWSKVGIAIIGVIVLNGCFAFWQEWRIERTLTALKKLLPQQSEVLREGRAAMVPVEQLVPGDIILLESGDHIPADCRLIEAYGVRVNNASVTGESLPQARVAAPMERDEELIHATNVLLAGTFMVAGQARAVIYATGTRTEFGRIAHLSQSSAQRASPLKVEMNRISRTIVMLAAGIGTVFSLAAWLIAGLPLWKAFLFSVGIIVALVPEAMLATLTLALVFGTQRMARRNVLIRYLPAVETLGSTTVICTDKTGTLTQNRMKVVQIGVASGKDACQLLNPEQIDPAVHRQLLMTALFCHDLRIGNGAAPPLGDPMEIALFEMAKRALPEQKLYPKTGEIPFDTDRLRLSSIHALPDGEYLYCKGAPETVLPLCSHVSVDGERSVFSEKMREQVRRRQEEMAEKGLRVLALAFRAPGNGWRDSDNPEQELEFVGLVGLQDPPRPEVPDAIRLCREAGIRVIMITGDHPRTAVAIGCEIGLAKKENVRVITGGQLQAMSETQLMLALDSEVIFARISADQKRRIVEALRHKGHIVAVTGDGVNDAPALRSAHIGIAMGIAGTDVAKESADMVLLDDNFASIVSAIEEGRGVFENIRKFLTYILTSNIAELVPYLAFVLFKIPLGLTLIQVLLIDLGTDSLPAIALGAEKPDSSVMQHPPRQKEEPLLDGRLAFRAFVLLGLMEAAAGMAAFMFVLLEAGWEYGGVLANNDPLYLKATSACLCAVVFMQIVNVCLCRSDRQSVFSSDWQSNPMLIGGIAFEIAVILLIVYTPWGNAVFGTEPVGLSVWLLILPFAGAMLLFDELIKRARPASNPASRIWS